MFYLNLFTSVSAIFRIKYNFKSFPDNIQNILLLKILRNETTCCSV